MADIFISYSRRDDDFARKLVNALEADGRTVWIDRQIRAGTQFPDEIRNELDAAAVVIYIISPDSVESPWCQRELADAIQNHKRIIPLLYRPADMSGLPSEVAHVQGIDFADAEEEKQFSTAFATLQHALDTDLDAERQGALLLVRARTWEAQNGQVGPLTGKELDEAERWLAKAAATKVAPTELHVRYITSSRRRQTARQRRTIMALSVGMALLLILTTVSLVLLQTVRTRDVQITTQRDAALLALEASNASANGQIDLALLLGAQANALDDSPLTRDAVVSQLVANPALRTILHPTLFSLDDVVLSHDGTTLAVIGTDSTRYEEQIELVTVSNPSHVVVGVPITLPYFDASFQARLAFTPDDSRIIAMASQTHLVAVTTVHARATVERVFTSPAPTATPPAPQRLARVAVERVFTSPQPAGFLQSLVAVSNTQVFARVCFQETSVPTCGFRTSVFVWNIADGSLRGSFTPLASDSSIQTILAGSPDGQTLVVGSCGNSCASYELQAWNLATESRIGRPFPLDSSLASTLFVPEFVFSRDSSYGLIYTNCFDPIHYPSPGCYFGPSNQGQPTAQLFRVTPQGVQAASALTSFGDISAIVGATILPGAKPEVAFEQTGIGSNLHGRISLWNSSSELTGIENGGVVADHLVGDSLIGDAFSLREVPDPFVAAMPLLANADGTLLFSPYGTDSVLVWDLTGNSGTIFQRLTGVGAGNQVLAQRLDTGSVLWRDATQQTAMYTNSADIGTQLRWNGQVAEIWHNGKGTSTYLGNLPGAQPNGTLELSANGHSAAEIDPGNTHIQLWDVPSRTLLATFTINGQSTYSSTLPAVFSPASDLFVYIQGGDLVGWDLRTHAVRFHSHSSDLFSAIVTLAFAADGHTVAAVDSSGAIWLWDATQGTLLRELRDPLIRRTNSAPDLVFSDDGQLLASQDGVTVTIWSVPSTAPLFHVQLPVSGTVGQLLVQGTVDALLFNPAGASLIFVMSTGAAGADGHNSVTAYSIPTTAQPWQSDACQVAGRTFTRAEWQQYLPEHPYSPVCSPTT